MTRGTKRRSAAVLAAAVTATGAAAGCSTHREPPEVVISPATSLTPSSPSIAAPPSQTWVRAVKCPTAAAMTRELGVGTSADAANDDIATGCTYSAGQNDVDIRVIQGDLAANRRIWANPPADYVYAAPRLAAGALIVYTPSNALDQCLVAVEHPRSPAGTLTVQLTRNDGLLDPQQRCAPLGAVVRALGR